MIAKLCRSAMQHFLLALIRLYQFIVSPLFLQYCRFYASCSESARQSLIKNGPLRGSWRALVRLSKCHPFHPGGVDLP